MHKNVGAYIQKHFMGFQLRLVCSRMFPLCNLLLACIFVLFVVFCLFYVHMHTYVCVFQNHNSYTSGSVLLSH